MFIYFVCLFIFSFSFVQFLYFRRLKKTLNVFNCLFVGLTITTIERTTMTEASYGSTHLLPFEAKRKYESWKRNSMRGWGGDSKCG